MSYISPKITLNKLSNDDIAVISNACSMYHADLLPLLEKENRAQQFLHVSILQVFRHKLLKLITNRFPSKSNTLSMETYTAFVCFDAIQHYSNHCDSYLEQAIIRRLSISLHQELPNTSDKHLSIMSELNFER